jgi:ubiquinone/menaquinone biosynthesis C-methylase UbiE
MNDLSDTSRGQIDAVNAISTAFVRSQVLFTANALEVFSLLEAPASAADVARERDLDPRGARMLLDGLVALDLVTKAAGRYVNAPAASECLVPGKPTYQGHIIRHQSHGWEMWGRMPESIREGRAVDEGPRERSPEELRAFILGMSDIGRHSAADMLEALDLSPYRHMLDLGGGPATYAIAFLKANPQMRATVFDLPEVCDIAREQVALAKMNARFEYVCGDFVTDPIGKGYDLILVSNIIHSLGQEKNLALMIRCYEALEAGGLLIVKDFLTDPDRSGPPFSLLFALRMLLATGEGDTYTAEEVAAWTRAAGFEAGKLLDLTPQTRLWLVHKPMGERKSA